MFIQVIHGKVKDPEVLHRRLELWERDVEPGAIGYLGSTAGCTSRGDCIAVVRFQSRAMAQRNADRPEQTAWWRETEKCFTGPVTFHESEEVDIMEHGRLDDAHFVQVMEGHVSDRRQAKQLEHEADAVLARQRPELLGSVTAYYDNDDFTELAYFTDEAAARRGEKKPMPQEAAAAFTKWQQVMKIDRYLDIDDPWMTSV